MLNEKVSLRFGFRHCNSRKHDSFSTCSNKFILISDTHDKII